jgi:hypothetical protein
MKNGAHYGKKVNEVYQTSDYTKFKFRDDNRVINPNHVKNISKNMKSKGWLSGSYVVVNQEWEVIDGQHRVLAAQSVGVPISYTMEKGADFDTIRDLNRNQKNWSIFDHIHGFVSEGNKNYINLSKFIEDFPDLRPTECLMLLRNQSNSVSRTDFESGKFQIKDLSKGYTWGGYLMSLKPFFEGYNRSIFCRGLIKILSSKPEFKFDEFLHKIKLRPSSIHLCGDVDSYIIMIEEIYNYKRRNDEKLNLRF